MLVGSKRRSCVGQRRALRPSSGRLVSCPLWQVVTAETLMDPSDFSESQPAPTAGEVGEALRACSWQEGRVLQEGGSHACGSLARVSGWRMWTGTASPTGTPTSSPTLSSTQIKSNATGWGLLGTRGGRACLGWCGPPFGVPGTGPSNPPNVISLICRVGLGMKGKGSGAISVQPRALFLGRALGTMATTWCALLPLWRLDGLGSRS